VKRKLIGSALLLLGVLMAVPSLYGIQTSFFVPTHGSISMVKLYWDANCTTEVTQVYWGSIVPGSTVNQTIYIKNFADVPVNVTLTPTNWNPIEAADYLTFSTDITGNVTAHFVQQTTLFLAVSLDILNTTISTFSFDIQISEVW
jgi:hypothetical protein